MFIELTVEENGEKTFVNLSDVKLVKEDSQIVFKNDAFINVEESYNQIKKLVKQEMAAERGY